MTNQLQSYTRIQGDNPILKRYGNLTEGFAARQRTNDEC